jgi:general secretion pathway protein D
MTKTSRALSFLVPMLLGGLQAVSAPAVRAQDIESVAQREIARREAGLPQGNEALARAQASRQAGDYVQAHEDYRIAIRYLPDAAVSGQARAQAVRGFAETGVKVAERRVQEGKYAEAEAICREILSDSYDPNYRPAMLLLTKLREPGQINRTMGPKFIDRVEEVRRLLVRRGRLLQQRPLRSRVQEIRADPESRSYNTAARRGQEKINNQKTRYGEEAYNETRSRATWQVQQAWENPVRKYGQTTGPTVDAFARDATGTARITNKLNTIIIPRIEFRDASIREAMDFLRQQAAANDPNPEGRRGVDIVLRLNQIGGTPVQPAPGFIGADLRGGDER